MSSGGFEEPSSACAGRCGTKTASQVSRERSTRQCRPEPGQSPAFSRAGGAQHCVLGVGCVALPPSVHVDGRQRAEPSFFTRGNACVRECASCHSEYEEGNTDMRSFNDAFARSPWRRRCSGLDRGRLRLSRAERRTTRPTQRPILCRAVTHRAAPMRSRASVSAPRRKSPNASTSL